MDMSPLLSFIVTLPVFATPDCRSEAVGITVGRIYLRVQSAPRCDSLQQVKHELLDLVF